MASKYSPTLGKAALILLPAVAVIGFAPQLLGGESNWERRFTSEARSKWREYESHAVVFQGSVSFFRITTGEQPRSVLNRRTEQLKQRADASLLITRIFSTEQEKGQERLAHGTLLSPTYGAELRRKQQDSPWFLLGFKFTPLDTLEITVHKRKLEYYTLHPLLIFNREHLLSEMLNEQGFKVKALSPSDDKQGLVRLSFDYHPRDRKAKNIRSGWVLLDPQHHWIIRQYDVEVEFPDGSGGQQTGIYEYKTGNSGFLLPKQFVWQQKGRLGNGKRVEFETKLDFDIVEDPNPSLREFSLSAFGLPEPEGYAEARPRWHWWVAGVAIALLILGAILRRAAHSAA